MSPRNTLLVAASCAAIGLQFAQASDSLHNDATSGGDFEGQQVHKLGSLNADYLCEKLFDSANPVSMFTELMMIVGPRLAISKMTGSEPKVDKEMYASLRIMARQKIWLPVPAEKEVGQWMDNKLARDGQLIDGEKLPKKLRKRYETVRDLLKSAQEVLPGDNPFQIRLGVMQGDESNALMNPGGFVYVTHGMLEDKTLDNNAIALRLAHEISHLTKRHTLKEIQVKIIDAMEISQTLMPLLNFATDPQKSMELIFGTKDATELMFARFGEVQELEADACGAHLLAMQTSIDAKKAIADFTEARKGTESPKGWENSHPPPAERSLVMTAQIDGATYGRLAQRRASPGNTQQTLTSAETTPAAPVIKAADKTAAVPATRTAATSTLPANLDAMEPTSAGNAQPAATPSLMDRLKRLAAAPAASSAADGAAKSGQR